MKLSVGAVVSAGKMPKASQDLEGLLLGLHQSRRVSTNATQRVRPLGAGWALGMKPEGRWIEKDALALHLLDHRPLREHIFERLAAGQTARFELEAAQLGQRVILIFDRGADAVLGAQVAQENRDDQGVGLVACHLYKA